MKKELTEDQYWSSFFVRGKWVVFERPLGIYLHFHDHSQELLSGEKTEGAPRLRDDCEVTHLLYEWSENRPGLKAIQIRYQSRRYYAPRTFRKRFRSSRALVVALNEVCAPHDYRKRYNQVRKHLLNGDCYQVNLTYMQRLRFSGEWQAAVLNAIDSAPSAYAHFSSLPCLGQILISNSPECLFHLRSDQLFSMPIKGTARVLEESDLAPAKQYLSASAKEMAELDMITDLLRNDVARASQGPARIVQRRRFLRVPKLLHQYSLVATKHSGLTLQKVVNALFPGGSITGAPKPRVQRIISDVESSSREHYCGSTILRWGPNQFDASINIRTAWFNFTDRELCFGQGGGITLQCQWKQEYQEMLDKRASLLGFLGISE